MRVVPKKLSNTFKAFFDSEKSGGILLIVCTGISILVANSVIGDQYLGVLQRDLAGLTVEHWVNDGLMAVFFLLIGLELERELYNGELSSFRTALLPVIAAIGGVALPGMIHFALNAGTVTQAGVGIPMATDIAFSLGVLALLGNRIPASLKVFLVAFAVMDDLFAIIIIAIFYTAKFSIFYLAGAMAVWVLLIVLNHYFKVMSLVPYLIGGALMWFLMLKSGVHATIAGVLLAFAMPFSTKQDDEESPSHRLEHLLHKPVAFVILPIFALANTAIVIGADWSQNLLTANSEGIMAGLLIGKPLGILVVGFAAVTFGLCKLPEDLNWKHIAGAGMLGGIGFTMSIFITNLAFVGDAQVINASKIAVLLASLTAGIVGFIWLRLVTKSEE
ncbi:MAG TPA: Na+/H+ antiporter NhaA [Pyrinomonadaceae bacterium]|nr:Na+/H+ antiporter NhaA [Chloracidobacterium sp.]MBP9934166.1 Na+/H+ antiporter NhaA [Pyrinomonadaceae bacterium]MBK7801636.1 Na+/H+ antiporter NhaA [Chloracidobacterium sp.]MBK9436952.1 Na+/H+ antiporter NhaA [Chloracidobacterium sp.]MBL0241946.1 Na+/H+ antiporter NhaA [Chloracidobacterium sp.]